MRIRAFSEGDTERVVALWEACGLLRPWNDPRRDILRKLTEQRELFLVGEIDGRIMATVMAGYDGHRGWLNYLAVDPSEQRRGWGRLLVEHVAGLLAERGCPKLSLQVRAGNEAAVAFYRRLGFQVDDVVSMGRRLIADD
ncbi:MAG TPA: GNAT family acetyltransferase [Pseudolysinimonas sp.]|nr:GNAT family acetyltransferase [Pseudolysinimonas sp.]